MTAETLHDAIGLLPADLVAEADRLRTRKQKIIPWKRYAAMAACFAIVLSCGLFAMELFAPKGATETAAQAPAAAAPLAPVTDEAPAEEIMKDTVLREESAAEEAPALNKTTGSGETAEPEAYFFCDVRTLMAPLNTDLCIDSTQSTLFQNRAQLDAFIAQEPDIAHSSGELDLYDESWFEYQDLLLVRLPSEKSEYRPDVLSLTNPYPQWQLTLRWETTPEDNAVDPVLWYLFVGVCKDMISPEDAILTVADPAS